jgi:hypothetical protein
VVARAFAIIEKGITRDINNHANSAFLDMRLSLFIMVLFLKALYSKAGCYFTVGIYKVNENLAAVSPLKRGD